MDGHEVITGDFHYHCRSSYSLPLSWPSTYIKGSSGSATSRLPSYFHRDFSGINAMDAPYTASIPLFICFLCSRV